MTCVLPSAKETHIDSILKQIDDHIQTKPNDYCHIGWLLGELFNHMNYEQAISLVMARMKRPA